MALNPNIILQGRGLDLVDTLDRSAVAGQRRREMDQQNALTQFMQQNGQAVLAGDQNALNNLAQFGQAGLQTAQATQSQRQGLEAGQLGMDATRQRMGHAEANQARLTREEMRAVQQQAAQMSAQERAAAAAETEQAVAAGMAARSPQEWDAMMSQVAPDLVGQFDNREMIAGKFMSVAQVLKRQDDLNATPEPADEYGRYVQEERAEGRQPLSRIDYAQAKKGTETIFGPDGQPIVQRGPSGMKPPKLTVDAAKNTGFLIRTEEANKVLNELERQGTRYTQQALENVPMGLGNYGRDPDFQRFDQARRDFVNAILRRESGAVISDQEFENANQQYFPVPGDSPEVIEQKRQNRTTAIRGLEVGSGDGAAFVRQQDQAAAPQAGIYDSPEAFAADPGIQAAAAEAGVTVQEMWEVLQEGRQ